MLALAVMSTAMVSLGIATGFERRYGVLKRLGSTPLSRGGLLAAKTANVLAHRGRAGRRDHRHRASRSAGSATGGVVPRSACSCRHVAFAGIGMLMAGTLRAEANLAAANGLFLVLLFLGGMAYPLDRLPDRARGVRRGCSRPPRCPRAVRGVLTPATPFPTGRVRRARRLGRSRAPLLAARCLPLGGVSRALDSR